MFLVICFTDFFNMRLMILAVLAFTPTPGGLRRGYSIPEKFLMKDGLKMNFPGCLCSVEHCYMWKTALS